MNNKLKISIACGAVVAIAAATMMLLPGCQKDAEISQTVDVLESVTEATDPTMPVIENFVEEGGLTGLAESLLKINDDVVGYIKIDDTVIDYPVVQYTDDPEYGNDFYLHRGMDKEYDFGGSIFMDYRDVFGADEEAQTENVVLYGHNLLNGLMFTDLHNYRTDEEFYEKSPIIEFSSNYKDYQYIIFGYFVTSGSRGDSYYGEDFPYWDIHDLSNPADFNDYLDVVYERSMISPDIDVAPGDKLLTLSTCHLDYDNSRFIVIARRLRDHETIDNIDKKQ